jgi:hypothetical protein
LGGITSSGVLGRPAAVAANHLNFHTKNINFPISQSSPFIYRYEYARDRLAEIGSCYAASIAGRNLNLGIFEESAVKGDTGNGIAVISWR